MRTIAPKEKVDILDIDKKQKGSIRKAKIAYFLKNKQRNKKKVLEKTFELTPRLALRGETQYDTRHRWEGSAALTYLIHKDVSLVGRWHSDFGFGGGLQIRF